MQGWILQIGRRGCWGRCGTVHCLRWTWQNFPSAALQAMLLPTQPLSEKGIKVSILYPAAVLLALSLQRPCAITCV